MSKRFLSILLAVLVVLIGGFFVWRNAIAPTDTLVGGDRDAHGCLIAAGYAFDEDVGACIRAFEMTPDIKNAAKLAVEKVGMSYALTVVSFNSYEEPGAYDLMLERGTERRPITVIIKDGEVQSVSENK